MIPLFGIDVQNGKVKMDSPQEFRWYLSGIKGRYNLKLEKPKKKISTLEHRYYRGVIVPIVAEEIGVDVDVAHKLLKSMFLKLIIWKEIEGKQIKFEYVKSTANLSTIEAETYYEECRRWAVEFLGCIIPLPEKIQIE